MTIDLDNTKMTLDFGYSDENTSYRIRFHYTEELGDTISLSENGKDYLSYPALMFVDVGTFLKDRKLVDTDKKEVSDTPNSNTVGKKINNIIKNSSAPSDEEIGISGFGGLAVPQIEGETDILSSEDDAQPSNEIPEQDDVNSLIHKFADSSEDLVPPDIDNSSDIEITEEDVEREWLLNNKNKVKTTNEANKIKKRKNSRSE